MLSRGALSPRCGLALHGLVRYWERQLSSKLSLWVVTRANKDLLLVSSAYSTPTAREISRMTMLSEMKI